MSAFKAKTLDDAKLLFAVQEVRKMLKSRGGVGEKEFDMSSFSKEKYDVHGTYCGTSHCIGGWMNTILREEDSGRYTHDPLDELQNLSSNIHSAVYKLFYPKNDALYNSKKKHAVVAIDNFLAGARDPWKGVEI